MSGVAVEESRAGVCLRKKTLSPGHRRDLAQRAVAAQLCSGRSACRILRLARSTYWYRGQPLSSRQAQLRQRLRELSEQHPRSGYRRITALLRQAGWAVGKRQIQRLRQAEGLRVPPTKRKVVRRGVSTGWPVKADHHGHHFHLNPSYHSHRLHRSLCPDALIWIVF